MQQAGAGSPRFLLAALGSTCGRDQHDRIEEEQERDRHDRLQTTGRDGLADENRGADQQRTEWGGRRRVVQAIERVAHQQDPETADELGADAEREQDVDDQVAWRHNTRPKKRAKISPPIQAVPELTSATLK